MEYKRALLYILPTLTLLATSPPVRTTGVVAPSTSITTVVLGSSNSSKNDAIVNKNELTAKELLQ